MERSTMRFGGMMAVCLTISLAMLAGGCSSKKKGGVYDSDIPGESGEIVEEGSMVQFEETGTVVSGGEFEDLYFPFDSDRLDASGAQALQNNAAILGADPDRRIEIEGHCDERGTSEYNLALGARRARAVKDGLVDLGVSADRMSTVSYGEELPICKELNESCWALNRRVHIVELNR
jgi:peptidoglycan-associated lipoprotein